MRFLDVRTDCAFQMVFGSQRSRQVLRHFLNAMLEYEDEHEIRDVEIVDPGQVPLVRGMKDCYVNVRAVLANDSHVLIEMQVLDVESIEQPVLYNAARLYSSQLRYREHYRLINPVIALTFTDFVFFADTPEQMMSRYRLAKKQRLMDYDIELVFVELPKFRKEGSELAGAQDQWIYFIKNARTLDRVPDCLTEPMIRQALEWIDESTLSARELETMHQRREVLQMQRDALGKARINGVREGFEQGRQAERQAVARVAHGQGLAAVHIAQLLGCTLEEVQRLLAVPSA
ncbi:hypothetical protein Cenrod_2188 [Candidatus Symbiobacter mobilis CR]|uniref:Rpn family recombination-promoting nuclease/putative transposase n=2 Tax=Candidatus Symbiobacter TaxID=1436289 RepID=U5N9K8_9BURK|nr:hypothetical protein Cenrod_2188 [Candidatus Symbiobacter mobilis CR]